MPPAQLSAGQGSKLGPGTSEQKKNLCTNTPPALPSALGFLLPFWVYTYV